MADEIDNLISQMLDAPDPHGHVRELARAIRTFYAELVVPDPQNLVLMPEDAAVAITCEWMDRVIGTDTVDDCDVPDSPEEPDGVA